MYVPLVAKHPIFSEFETFYSGKRKLFYLYEFKADVLNIGEVLIF